VAANPALWTDVLRDLAVARQNAADLAMRAETLERRGGRMEPDVRRDREIAVGSMLHNCYGAIEAALERLIVAVDGSLPSGRDYHAEVIRRAATPVPDVRPAMISDALAADLQRLRQFRHVFRYASTGYDYDRAAENVPVAVRAVDLVATELGTFASAIHLIDQPR
jgi:hypothetical protein